MGSYYTVSPDFMKSNKSFGLSRGMDKAIRNIHLYKDGEGMYKSIYMSKLQKNI
jgi:hypothetical protein